MKIELELTLKEIEKLRDACDHLEEESRDDIGDPDTIWESEEFWSGLSKQLDRYLKND